MILLSVSRETLLFSHFFMSGIYLHVPFCKRVCFYCDFYKCTNLLLKDDFLRSLKIEILNNSSLLSSLKFETFYIGGGTPSILTPADLKYIFDLFKPYLDFSTLKEITIEVNPDDFTDEWMEGLKQTPVNRISFGFQTVFDDFLKLLNRRHDHQQSIDAVIKASQNGYNNLSIDLIYGLPGLTIDQWRDTLNEIVQLPIQHVSAYHLSYEQGTVFYSRLQKGLLKEVDEELSLLQFNELVKILSQSDFDHYELSSFSKPNFQSRHNSIYWNGDQYVGFGPSAHSFYGGKRYSNVSDVAEYIRLLNNNLPVFQCESLTDTDIYNESVMLGLRTSKGIPLSQIQSMPIQYYQFFEKNASSYIDNQMLLVIDGYVIVSPEYRFITDKIISDLFYVD